MTPAAQARTSIAQHIDQHLAADRAAHLLARIKIEARWLLISAPARSYDLDETYFAEDRASLVARWPDIRHRRVPAQYLNQFYDLVADQASQLVHLIEIRRQRRARARQ